MRFDDALHLANWAWTRAFNWLHSKAYEAQSMGDSDRLNDLGDMNMAFGIGLLNGRSDNYVLAVRAPSTKALSSEVYSDIYNEAAREVHFGIGKYSIGPLGAPLGYHDKKRPLVAGHSVGHHKITAGTIGAFVKGGFFGSPMILSNNHVLANSNEARRGDAILQPGNYDGGKYPEDVVGKLSDFEVIKESGNIMDAAIATISSKYRPNDVKIPEIGLVTNNIVEPRTKIKVQKSGRTTGHTVGTVSAVGLRGVAVNYGNGKIWSFDNCIEVSGEFSAGGDSGSLVVDMDRNPVGLLFAGGGGFTIVNPIGPITKRFGIKFLS